VQIVWLRKSTNSVTLQLRCGKRQFVQIGEFAEPTGEVAAEQQIVVAFDLAGIAANAITALDPITGLWERTLPWKIGCKKTLAVMPAMRFNGCHVRACL
jgi:hypothetical protein